MKGGGSRRESAVSRDSNTKMLGFDDIFGSNDTL